MVLDTTREREREKYLVTDAELIRRLGVPEKDARRVLGFLDAKQSGFPPKLKMWGGRRWWPHVEEWFARSSGMISDDAARLIPENRPRSRSPRHSPLRSPAEGHPND
jgi:hypothetical protein